MTSNIILLLFVAISVAAFDQNEENKAKDFLTYYNSVVVKENFKSYQASWDYATNLTEYNKKIKTTIGVQYSLFMQVARQNASVFNVDKLSYDTKRQINMIKSSSTPKSKEDVTNLNDMESDMESIYSSGTVIDKDGTKLQLDPELTTIMRTSKDYDRLVFAWKGWRDATGPKLRPIYEKFVNLSNKGAKENNWADKGAYWRSWYEDDDFENSVARLYDDLKPLYEELHAYVRYKLMSKYPGKVTATGPIPAHILGNMWAQSWVNIYDLVEPYKGQPSLDVTQNMIKQKYTPLKMVELAESFFTSIGLKPLPKSFYTKSLIEKPKDGRDVICHASAWDFSTDYDVR